MEESSKQWDVFRVEHCPDCSYDHPKMAIALLLDVKTEYGTAVYVWQCLLLNSGPQNMGRDCDFLVNNSQHQDYLEYDSYVDVANMMEFPDSVLDKKVGHIRGSQQRQIIAQIEKCGGIPRKLIRRIGNSIG